MENVGLNFGWKKNAGLICLWFIYKDYNYNLHLCIQKSYWEWGYRSYEYDGPNKVLGFGPLFIFCWGWI